MTLTPFGRATSLVSKKAEGASFRLGLEAIESGTGRLVAAPINEYDSEGIAFAVGDVLFGKLRPYLAKAWLADRPGAAVGDFHVYRPDPAKTFPAYLRWALLARSFLDPVESSVFGTKMPRASWDFIKKVEIFLPTLDEQQAIADYLDHETAQIDELITEQERLIELLSERQLCAIDAELQTYGFGPSSDLAAAAGCELPPGWQLIKLSQVLDQLTNGYVGPTRDILMDEGIRYVQGMHIKDGRIDFDRLHFFVSPEWHKARPRIHLRQGDVLIVQTGDVGRVAVVPPEFGEASCHALQIARVRPEILSGEYLATYLSSRFGYNSLLYRASGALHPHLEGAVRAVPIVVPPLDVQEGIVEAVTRLTARIRHTIGETERFIELAKERRSALITAAVTGQIDVRSAA